MKLILKVFALALIWTFISTASFAQGKLIFAVDIIRHGDRTPYENVPLVPHHWKLGLGQLTPTGMHQEFLLGKSKRDIYVKQFHLLPVHYSPGTIYVRSTDLDRTLMSAESFLLGLYPLGTGPYAKDGDALPDRFQPIPLRTVPNSEEQLLYPSSSFYKIDELIKKYIQPTKAWREHKLKLKPHFAEWSRKTGVKIKNLDDLRGLSDALYVGTLYDVPLPPNLSKEEAKQIIQAGSWVYTAEYSDSRIGKITGHKLLQKIANYLDEACNKNTPLKYVLFSAHDDTLLSQMSALESPLDIIPHYASNLNYSLFENSNGQCQIKISINGLPVYVPKCGGSSCSLEQVKQIAAETVKA